MKKGISLGALVLFLAACEGGTGPGNGGNVVVKFGTGSSSSIRATAMTAGDLALASDLTVTGTNGTLNIDDIRFIVEELELRSSESNAACDDNEGEDDDLRVSADHGDGQSGDDEEDDDEDETSDECEFDGGPFIVDLPLDGKATITTENVPAGTYDSFKFKIDDLEGGDDDEADDRVHAPQLLSDIRAVYPDFPARASMVVHGTQNGTPFTVYFRSKIRVEQAISPPLVVPGDQVLTVNLDPSMWFKVGNQVLNLAALNGRLVDLATFRDGIVRIHHGED
jgi:hypothetical protein